MAYPFVRKRQSRFPSTTDMADRNGNGYPDSFESEEAQLLAQIAARRKTFMQQAEQAEDMFTNTNEAGNVGDGDGQSVIDNLLK